MLLCVSCVNLMCVCLHGFQCVCLWIVDQKLDNMKYFPPLLMLLIFERERGERGREGEREGETKFEFIFPHDVIIYLVKVFEAEEMKN